MFIIEKKPHDVSNTVNIFHPYSHKNKNLGTIGNFNLDDSQSFSSVSVCA